MDWIQLQRDNLMPPAQFKTPRKQRLWRLRQVLHGRQYDQILHSFDADQAYGGGYIPLAQRRPSIRTNMCYVVVAEAASLLFSETHWPEIKAHSPEAVTALRAFARVTNLSQVMTDAAICGSVGSCAVLFEVIDGVPFLSVIEGEKCSPVWAPDRSGLLKVRHEECLTAGELIELGYSGFGDKPPTTPYIVATDYLRDETIVYRPAPVAGEPVWTRDAQRSVRHGLGFVPLVWIANLSAARCVADGPCTFERAIDTVIEADYLLSQGARALRYTGDPQLALSGAASLDQEQLEGGSAKVLLLPDRADAKLLEINGNSVQATLSFCRELRAIVLEQLHGNKAHPDKIAASQSGRAMEMMTQSLIWLADRLRHSYGSNGLIEVYRMACRMTQIVGRNTKDARGLKLDGERVANLDAGGLDLQWPPWYPPSGQDMNYALTGLTSGVQSGFVPVKMAAEDYARMTGRDPQSVVGDLPPAQPKENNDGG